MTAKIIGLILIFVSVFIALNQFLPEDSKTNFKVFFLSEAQKQLFRECERFRKSMIEQKLPIVFGKVDFLVREERLKNDPLLSDLQKCFAPNSNSPIGLEIEIFSSDFGNWSSDDVQVQISVLDLKSSNKISEFGFRLDHKAPANSANPAAHPSP